jgi:hypothetical protein
VAVGPLDPVVEVCHSRDVGVVDVPVVVRSLLPVVLLRLEGRVLAEHLEQLMVPRAGIVVPTAC